SLRFSPKHPKKILQLNSPENALRETQKYFYALDLNVNKFVPSTDDGINLQKIKIKDVNNETALKYLASTYDSNNNILYDGINRPGTRIITFAGILQYNRFPLAEILDSLLESGSQEMNHPVEIEFAANLETPPGIPKIFSFLQIRPIVHNEQTISADIDKVEPEETIVWSSAALGNGVFRGIHDIIYLRQDSFNPSMNERIAEELEKINALFQKEGTGYVLIGPGRWGSSDPWLGVPVKWPQISAARIIVEAGLANYRVDPSQGTHFFQNLTSFRVGYFTVNPFEGDGFFDEKWLNQRPAVHENQYLRHVRFTQPLGIMIDGRKHKGVVLKPLE
ncbi:MAG: phosphoenolpyruvate synthase, partial [Bacteroidales bacterium]|nr:phosphoenolpyruvate synthase [Bacteroidales bacterium]